MKTAREKAEYWLNDNVAGWNEHHLRTLTTLLKEQDHDTRRACTKAVLQCDEDVSGECILKSDAYSACMDAKAV